MILVGDLSNGDNGMGEWFVELLLLLLFISSIMIWFTYGGGVYLSYMYDLNHLW